MCLRCGSREGAARVAGPCSARMRGGLPRFRIGVFQAFSMNRSVAAHPFPLPIGSDGEEEGLRGRFVVPIQAHRNSYGA